MPTGLNVRAALEGAVRLARFDASGADAFGYSGLEAWRSFYAAVIVAPMFFIWLALHGLGTPDDAPFVFAALYELLVYMGGWFLFPVVVYFVARAFGRDAQYARFVTAYNWSAVVQNVVFLGADLILMTVGAPDGARAFFGMILLGYVLIYAWFVARTVLEIEPGQAVLVVGLDVLCAVAWEQFSDGLV